ncbi:DUF1735 domain-containing protein [Pedobacter sp. MC2016-14]|uniref:BT_3987 domain-containing protein n=1 Tax=Pedobacter sp. MC2016-14 TaxID=2897327 RepID=UPI001E331830|nr:DUF1735 domain-containing protein [Pedobacter sp. MC2016-14]MCD0488701.1 DUF1735 domain-containing protein [Pedobacter sp. MC2016-14]
MKSLTVFRNKCILLVAATVFLFSACKKKETFTFNGDDKNRVFFNVENNTFKGYNSFAFSVIQFGSGPSGADIKASFPARITQESEEDVKVTYGVDNSKIAAYNAANNTSYVAVPDGMVTLGADLTIPKGALISSTNLDFSIPRDKMSLLTAPGYLIPLQIKSVTGANTEVSSNASTVYVVVTAVVTNEFERTNWTIHSFSTQEATGEGANNGRAVFLLDNVLSTFWTSQWNGSEPAPPHFVAFDMKATLSLSGLYITGRQVTSVSGPPKTIVVEVSNDGTTWQNAGTYELALVQTRQTVAFPQKYSARYFKVTVTVVYGTSRSTYLSEVSAY